MSELPYAVWSGSFTICGVEIKCHTLSDGQRIIEEDSMEKFLQIMNSPIGTKPESVGDIEAFMNWRLSIDPDKGT